MIDVCQIFCNITLNKHSTQNDYLNLSFKQTIEYICKDGMRMKEDFHRRTVIVKCNDNNTFDLVETWPECASSKDFITMNVN